MLTMKRLLVLALTALLSISVIACEDDADEADGDEAETEAQQEDDEGAEADDEGAEADDDAEAQLEKVEVAADGTEFDPPVEKEQIPEGAWICDMGTVHYAQKEEGDATCPLCNMDLVAHGEADDDSHAHDHE